MTTLQTASNTNRGRLRHDLQVVRQPGLQGVRVLVTNPATEKSYMFSELSFRILCQVYVGADTRAIVRAISGAEVSEEVIARTDCLIQSARDAGLFADATPAAVPARTKRIRWNPFFLTIPLFRPQKLDWILRPLARVLFSIPAALAWIAAVIGSVALMHLNWHEYLASFSIFQHFKLWPAVYVAVVVSTLVHETGHVLACRRFGVEVRQVGVLFYLFTPGAFSDVSAAWLLPKCRQRLVISLGGIYLESLVWMAAVLCWYLWRDTAAGEVSFVMVLVMSPRMIFNLIPLLRLDGYWVVCDLLQINHLRSKSFAYLLSHVPVVGRTFRPWRKPTRKEATVFMLYGILGSLSVMGVLGLAAARLHSWLVDLTPKFGESAFWCVVVAVLVLAVPSLRRQAGQLSRAQRGL
jgi:hypothetical protein